MTPGSFTENQSGSGRAGIPIQDCSLPARELVLASALESASLVGLAGAGTTGATIGITTASFTTTTPTYLTAGFSSIATTSIAPVDFMVAGFPVAEASRHRGTALRRHMPRPALIPERSAVSIMEEWREDSRLEDSRALAEASMAVEVSEAEASTAEAAVTAEAVEGNSVQLPQTKLMIRRKNSCAQTI